MIAKPLFQRIFLIVVYLCLLLAAENALANPNATIVNGNVHLRESYPTFSISTLYKFTLKPGRIIAVIPVGSRIEVLGKKIVANTQEWLKATYVAGPNTLTGWVYAGPVGDRKYVRLDAGVHVRFNPDINEGIRIADIGVSLLSSEITVDALHLLFPRSAHAQTAPNSVITAPEIGTDPVRTLLITFAYLVIFVGSLYVVKRWIFPNSNICALVTGLFSLLILGFISETTFSNLIAGFLAK